MPTLTRMTPLVSVETSPSFRKFSSDVKVALEARHAAVRCLSCETSLVAASKDNGGLGSDEKLDAENLILFSDNHCNAASVAFRLKDSQARGLKRTFGLILLSDGDLIISW